MCICHCIVLYNLLLSLYCIVWWMVKVLYNILQWHPKIPRCCMRNGVRRPTLFRWKFFEYGIQERNRKEVFWFLDTQHCVLACISRVVAKTDFVLIPNDVRGKYRIINFLWLFNVPVYWRIFAPSSDEFTIPVSLNLNSSEHTQFCEHFRIAYNNIKLITLYVS